MKLEPQQPRVNTRFLLAYNNRLELRVGDDTVLFYRGEPIAIITYGVVYFPDVPNEGARTRHINAFEPAAPHVRLAPAEYDFVIGAALTRLGITLARKEQSNG
jgi:hypothetical protein